MNNSRQATHRLQSFGPINGSFRKSIYLVSCLEHKNNRRYADLCRGNQRGISYVKFISRSSELACFSRRSSLLPINPRDLSRPLNRTSHVVRSQFEWMTSRSLLEIRKRALFELEGIGTGHFFAPNDVSTGTPCRIDSLGVRLLSLSRRHPENWFQHRVVPVPSFRGNHDWIARSDDCCAAR